MENKGQCLVIIVILTLMFPFPPHIHASESIEHANSPAPPENINVIQVPAFDYLDDPNICLADLTPKQLVPYILNRDYGPDGCRLAGEWFVWKTQNMPEKQKLRTELADKIVEQINLIREDPNKSLHDVYYWAQLLGPLGAREQTIELLKKEKRFSCHYGPQLVESLGQCGTIEDIPFLIDCIDKEGDGNDAVVNKALQQLTDIEMPLKGYRTDKIAWQKWWEEYKNRK
jgi:hypothetical protein